MSIWVPVIVALIGGPMMWFLSRFDKRNTKQHGQNMDVLKEIYSDVKEIRSDVKDVRKDLYHHIDDHLKEVI